MKGSIHTICSDLNENVLNSIFLYIWSPVGGTVRENLGGVAFLEEICHWGTDFEVSKAQNIPC